MTPRAIFEFTALVTPQHPHGAIVGYGGILGLRELDSVIFKSSQRRVKREQSMPHPQGCFEKELGADDCDVRFCDFIWEESDDSRQDYVIRNVVDHFCQQY